MALAVLLLFAGLWSPVLCNDKLPLVINTWPFVDANKGGELLTGYIVLWGRGYH